MGASHPGEIGQQLVHAAQRVDARIPSGIDACLRLATQSPGAPRPRNRRFRLGRAESRVLRVAGIRCRPMATRGSATQPNSKCFPGRKCTLPSPDIGAIPSMDECEIAREYASVLLLQLLLVGSVRQSLANPDFLEPTSGFCLSRFAFGPQVRMCRESHGNNESPLESWVDLCNGSARVERRSALRSVRRADEARWSAPRACRRVSGLNGHFAFRAFDLIPRRATRRRPSRR